MATITYKCPNCGGGLIFAPKEGKFKCEYCGSVFTRAELDALAPDQASDQSMPGQVSDQTTQTGSDPEQTPQAGAGQEQATQAGAGQEQATQAGTGQGAGSALLYTCPSCGAQVVTDATTAATFCYYCHNPVVLEGKLSGKYLPDKLIPFRLDKKQATEEFLRYVRSKRFVPKAFFNKEQIEKLSGVYYPFWVYDCEVDSSASGKATRVRSWVSGDIQFTETNVFHFERGGDVRVQNLSRNALQESDRSLIDPVMPYRMEETVAFDMPYLQGFVAQRRDIESSQVAEELRQKARALAQTALNNSVTGYTTVSVEQSLFLPKKEQWQYVLLPVWVLTYGASSGKKYYYAMNGQTGEMNGVLPIDYGRLARTGTLVAVIVFIASLLLQWMVF